jgi:hypothetical protein
VIGDLLDLLRGFFVFVLVFGEVEAGDLEAVEKQAGSLGVEIVAGDALEDHSDGGLDGRAVLGHGQVEAGVTAEGFAWGGLAGGVVVVAEGLVAEADAAAAVAVGEDVAALVAFGFGLYGIVHSGLSPHLGVLVQSIQK